MTGASTYYLLMLFGFLALMLGLSVWVARRTEGGEDFLLAGRGLRTPLLLGTTLATLVGTGSSLGAVGFAYTSGWAGLLYGIGGAAGVFGLLWLFADARDHGFWTFPEEMSFYYGANAALKNVVAVVLFVAEIGWLGAHMLGGSIYLEYLTGIGPTLAKAIVAIGFGLYVIVGGYLADVITDAVQGVILFVGFSVLAVLSFREAGGLRGFSRNLPDDANSFLGMGEVGVIPAVSLAAVIAVGVLATPSYRQRIYSATSTATVRRSFLLVGILFALFAVMPAIAGMSARVLNPGIENSDQAFPFLATEVFPVWLGGLLLVSGLSATASSGDSDAVTAVTIFLRDVYRMIVGRLPAEENMVLYSRIGLAVVMSVAFVVTIFATSVIDYITLMISTVLSGLFVAAVLGKFWPRVTWQGGIACMVGGSATALAINASASWTEFWGNPVIPSLLAALLAGVVVSLLTPRRDVAEEEALRRLGEERSPVEAEPRAGSPGRSPEQR